MKKYKQKQKTIISSFFLMIYVFIVFFSGILHQHDYNSNFTKFSSEKNVGSIKNSSDDCLAFHLSHNQKTLLDAEFSFQLLTFDFEQKIAQSNEILSFSEEIFYFSLRAPPVFI